MSNQKKTHDLIRQNEQIVKKSHKHDSNLQKNSTLYFQVGLIVCLLMTYGLFEMKFVTTIPDYDWNPALEDPDYVEIPIIKMPERSIEEPVTKKVTKFINDYKEVIEDTPADPVEPTLLDPVIPDNPIFDPDAIPTLPEKPEDVIIPVNFVQKVPVYPGCEKYTKNEDLRNCLNEKIAKLIQRQFDTGLANEYGLSGIQKIDVAFKIDNRGHITDVKTRAPHPKLDEEAERVINLLPVMTPGMQNDKKVGVIYNLPIKFQVQD